MIVRIALALLIGWAAAGCQQKSQDRKQAPTGPKDVGILLDGSNAAEVESIKQAYPQAEVRTVNPAHGIFEVFGVTREELSRVTTKAQLSNNEYFTFRKLSVPAPEGLEVEGLNTCVDATEYPEAVAKVNEPEVPMNQFTIEIGKKVKISAGGSKAHAGHPSPLKIALLLIPPDSSKMEQKVTLGTEIEVQPDALGAYQIFVIVQDSRNVCALDAVRFIATANRPFQNVAETGRVDLNLLAHLKQVRAQESWQKSRGEGITIAVVDTGVHYNHPMLSGNMFINSAETADNGVDEDGNGFKDDVVGYDFINSDPFPYDDDGHGTHVSGLAAGRQFGMANQARIIAVKALTSIGGDAGSIAGGIMYAVDRGAKIINLSLGTTGPVAHPMIVRAMKYAEDHNVLVVAAAGNGDPRTGLGFDIDQVAVYPASLTNENILSVAAADAQNHLTAYSNFGKAGVDITAPGGQGREPLISAAHENPRGAGYVGMSGTSMAAPVVTGIAAQVWSLNPRMTPVEVKALLMKAGTETDELKRATVSGRLLSAESAVNLVAPSGALF